MPAIVKNMIKPTNELRITEHTITMVKIGDLQPHPLNRPASGINREQVETLKTLIAQNGYSSSKPLTVRRVDLTMQIIEGHHRWMAALELGFNELPCVITDLDDSEANLLLLMSNEQTGNNPLDIGLTALATVGVGKINSDLSVSGFARRLNKSQQQISRLLQAAKVFEVTRQRVTSPLTNYCMHLSEIHATPQWLWPALVQAMLINTWTVNVTHEKVAKLKDLIPELPAWMHAEGLANNILNGAVKTGDISRMIALAETTTLTGEFLKNFHDDLKKQPIASLSQLQDIHHRWITAQETEAIKAREIEVARQRATEAASRRIERLRAYCSLDEWKGLSTIEKSQLLLPEPYNATFNKQENQDIEWAQWSWNPITGCLHECSYCYARDIANSARMAAVYPNGFAPTFRSRSLQAPFIQKVPPEAQTDTRYKNVFTCSMADLFGRWVPAEWINAVLDTVRQNPQWNFLFLTKFPKRMAEFTLPANAWMGTSVDLQARVKAAEDAFAKVDSGVKWLSIEPMLEPVKFKHLDRFDWVVIGGASSSRQTPAWFPPIEWIVDLINQCHDAGCKVYLKSNLFGSSDQHRAINARILELPFDAPLSQDITTILPVEFNYLGK